LIARLAQGIEALANAARRRPGRRRFCSRLFGDGVTRTNALEALVISGWVRGLPDRDIEGVCRLVRAAAG
jgi:hypothetical protein